MQDPQAPGVWRLRGHAQGGVTEPGLCPSGGPRDRCRAPVEGGPGGLCQGGRPYPDAGPSKLGLPPRVAKGRGRNKAGEASSTPLLPGPPRATYLQDKENSLLFFFSFFFFPAATPLTHCLAGCLPRHKGSCDFSGLWKETTGDRDKGNRALPSPAPWCPRDGGIQVRGARSGPVAPHATATPSRAQTLAWPVSNIVILGEPHDTLGFKFSSP